MQSDRTTLSVSRRRLPSFNTADVVWLFLVVIVSCSRPPPAKSNHSINPSVTAEPVLEVPATEGVFAYARVSPDGRYLAYTAERAGNDGHPPQSTIRVVNIATHDILFTAQGVDTSWSPDGKRIVFVSGEENSGSVVIADPYAGRPQFRAAPALWGTYPTWGVTSDGRNVIMTVSGNFYDVSRDAPPTASEHLQPCHDIGTGDRPLISKDAKRATVFANGTVIVRDVADCTDILDTLVEGGKADFSYDGRFIAFHRPRQDSDEYAISIVDLKTRAMWSPQLAGSALFPSWSADGSLYFRYDSGPFRGFARLRHVVENIETLGTALPSRRPRPFSTEWKELFGSAHAPLAPLTAVVVWSTWSAHSVEALEELYRAQTILQMKGVPLDVNGAVEPVSRRDDTVALIRAHMLQLTLPLLRLSRNGLNQSVALNQIPAVLLFRGERLVDTRLGSQSADHLVSWIVSEHVNGKGVK
jgi:hypothetical protein